MIDLEKSDKLEDVNTMLNESFAPYYDNAFLPGETKEQLTTNSVVWLSTFISNVDSWLVGWLRGWSTDIIFSSSTYNGVAWTSGTIHLSNGNDYSISSWSLTLTSTHYIFLDTAVSTTVLQNTTSSEDSVGGTRLLVAFTKINSDTTLKAIIKTFGGQGDSFTVEGLNIAAAAVTAAKTSIAAINPVDGEINANKVWTTQIDTNAVTSAKILDSAITAAKTSIAALSPITGNLNSNTVDTAQIVSNAVTSLKLLDGAVTAAKTNVSAISAITGNLNTNTVDSAQLVDNAVTSLKVLDGAITSAKTNIAAIAPLTGNLNTGTVDTTQLVNDAVTSLKILDSAITTAKVATGAITEATIATSAITETKIASDAITTPKIFAGSITTSKIAAWAVTATEIAADTITASQIAANAITANELAANAVIAGKILAWSIVSSDIAADTITASNIAANAITSNELAANSVVAWKILAGTIVSADIAADTITASNIAADAITSNELASNSVVAGKIAAGTIVANDIATDAITATKILAGSVTANKLTTYNFIVSEWTFANNTPWAWSVSWTGAKVMYNGTEHTITNDNTTNKYVYWQLASPTVFATSATFPSIGNDDFLVLTNTSGTYTLVWNSTVVNGNRITTGSVTASNIAAGTITSNEIAATTITASNIAANTITSSQIAASTITATQIATGTITANEIAASTITANKMNINSLSAIAADLGTITAGTITGTTITGATIQTASWSGLRTTMTNSDNSVNFYDASNNNVMTLGYSGSQRNQIYVKSPNDGNNTYATAYVSSLRTNNTMVINAEVTSSTPVLWVIAQNDISSPTVYYDRPIAKFLNSSSTYNTLQSYNLSSSYAGFFKSVWWTSLYSQNWDGVCIWMDNASATHPTIWAVNTSGYAGYFEGNSSIPTTYIKNTSTWRGMTIETGNWTGIHITGSDANGIIVNTSSDQGSMIYLTNSSTTGWSTSATNWVNVTTNNTCYSSAFVNQHSGGSAMFLRNTSGSNNSHVLYALNSGTGNGIITKSNGSGNTLDVQNLSTGPAIYSTAWNSNALWAVSLSNTYPAIYADNSWTYPDIEAADIFASNKFILWNTSHYLYLSWNDIYWHDGTNNIKLN